MDKTITSVDFSRRLARPVSARKSPSISRKGAMALFLAGPVARGMHYATRNGISRTARLTLLNLLLVFVACAPSIRALPTRRSPFGYSITEDGEGKPADDPQLWAYLGTAVALVLLGGIFAGLTIAYVDQASPNQ